MATGCLLSKMGSVYAGKIFVDKLYAPHLTVLERVLLLDSRDVNLNSKIPDAVLHWACTVLSWPNAENRLFIILNTKPNIFPSLL